VLPTEQKDNNSAIAMLYPDILITSIKEVKKYKYVYKEMARCQKSVSTPKVRRRAPDEGC